MKIAKECPPAPSPRALMAELLRALPPAGHEFGAAERVGWLTGAAAVLDVAYGPDPRRPVVVVRGDALH